MRPPVAFFATDKKTTMPKPKTRKPNYSNIQRPTRKVGGKTITFRSRWEYNIAKWLQAQVETGKIDKWEYEPQPFSLMRPNGQTIGYLPDFRVTKGTAVNYIEVKGRMFPKDRMKIRLFREQHGSLDVIDSKKYSQIAAIYGSKLKF